MDWKDIKSLTEPEARLTVRKYFESLGYKCKEIDVKNLPLGKQSPDFEVWKDKDLAFLCEIKTPEHRLDPIFNVYKWDTTFYKIKKLIHKAVKQFKDYDPNHKYLSVIAFTSNHPQLDWSKFIHTVKTAVIYNGQVIRDLNALSKLNKWDQDLSYIDIVLWFQVNYLNSTAFKLDFVLNGDSLLLDEAERISKTFTPIER